MIESVRGLVFGSPEYIAIAKRGEKTVQADEIISEIAKLTDDLVNLSAGLDSKQCFELRVVRDDLNDLIGDYEIYYEY